MGKSAIFVGCLLTASLLTSGCSVVMAAKRSSYRGDVNVIREGVSRSEVIAELGQPDTTSTTEAGGFDDRYVLDPDAHRTWVKVLTMFFHLGATAVTGFIYEVIGTPYEIAARDRIMVYHLTYDTNLRLTAFEKIKP